MQIGKMRTPIIIQRVTTATSSTGSDVETWNTYKSTKSRVYNLTGRQSDDDDQLVANTRTIFHLRYFTSLSNKDRILMDGVTYNIESIDNINMKNREYKILATKIEQ